MLAGQRKCWYTIYCIDIVLLAFLSSIVQCKYEMTSATLTLKHPAIYPFLYDLSKEWKWPNHKIPVVSQTNKDKGASVKEDINEKTYISLWQALI
jgi:hypothetical protein